MTGRHAHCLLLPRYYGAPTTDYITMALSTYYITMARLGAQPALLKLAQHRHDPLARGHTALPALAAALAATAPALAATALAAAARIRLGAQPLDRGVACGGEGRRTYRSVLRLTHLLG